MDPESWRRIEALYRSVLEQEPTDRCLYLDAACRGDGDVRHEVASLLAQSDSSVPLLESTPASTRENQERMRSLPALVRGEILGHYRIASLLGEGGIRRVFRATDTRLGRAVAIKVSAEEFSNRFEREARGIDAARQILRAAHGAGIIHRYLKPANIMVRFDGYDPSRQENSICSKPNCSRRTVSASPWKPRTSIGSTDS